MFVRGRRHLVAAMVMAVVVASSVPALASGDISALCSAFPHSQTYRPTSGFFKAPAWFYDQTVTIVYEARSCDVFVDGAALRAVVSGRATVYAGESPGGRRIDVRPFTNDVSIAGPSDSALHWWRCDSADVSYAWNIDGVYRFSAESENGTWTHRQAATMDPERSESDSFDACALENASR